MARNLALDEERHFWDCVSGRTQTTISILMNKDLYSPVREGCPFPHLWIL
jgi:hypothetical protein